MNNQIIQYCNKHMLKYQKFENVMRILYSQIFKSVIERRLYFIALNRAQN